MRVGFKLKTGSHWVAITVAFVAAAFGPYHATAQAPASVAICNANGIQQEMQAITADDGCIIMTWMDGRDGGNSIYAQKISEVGAFLWPSNGVPIATGLTDQYTIAQVATDGDGGAIVAWTDVRGGVSGIYAQRVSRSGSVLWVANGATVSPNIGVRYTPKIMSDGAGGVILTWRGYKNANYNIYAQRIGPTGVKAWGVADVPIAVTAVGYKEECELVTDGQGGAIISWYDSRNGDFDVYAQRISQSGSVQWVANGTPVCSGPGDVSNPRLISDQAGGAIITWADYRSGNYDVYAQRMGSTGLPYWTANGVPVVEAPGSQWLPQIVTDGAGGAIIAWDDNRYDFNDVYLQRINSNGGIMWPHPPFPGDLVNWGVSVVSDVTFNSFKMVSDGAGGAIVAWKELRCGLYDLQYQHPRPPSGYKESPNRGIPLAVGTTSALAPELVINRSGRVIAAWDDNRNGAADIYGAQALEPVPPASAHGWELYE